MELKIGRSYHIKNEFFSYAKDDHLMSNKEGKGKRPHFVLIKDGHNADIYWAIPQSSQIKKYTTILMKKKEKYGRCDTIVIGKFGGKDSAFLIQNMFPVIKNYIDHEHTISGISVKVNSHLYREIVYKAQRVLRLHYMGCKIIFPNIDRIYKLMEEKISHAE